MKDNRGVTVVLFAVAAAALLATGIALAGGAGPVAPCVAARVAAYTAPDSLFRTPTLSFTLELYDARGEELGLLIGLTPDQVRRVSGQPAVRVQRIHPEVRNYRLCSFQ